MRVLVCGGREFVDYGLLSSVLSQIYWKEHNREEEFIIIAGEAIGADFLAKVWVHEEFNIPEDHYIAFPAKWKEHGKSAGPIRNQQMIDEGKPDLVVAFPGGVGTADMVRRAEKHNIEVRLIDGNKE